MSEISIFPTWRVAPKASTVDIEGRNNDQMSTLPSALVIPDSLLATVNKNSASTLKPLHFTISVWSKSSSSPNERFEVDGANAARQFLTAHKIPDEQHGGFAHKPGAPPTAR